MLIVVAVVVGLMFAVTISLRAAGLLIPYRIPAAGMQPAIQHDDQIAMEGVTYLFRTPRRGEMIVFSTNGIPSLAPNEVFVKRVAGVPGDRLRIADGRLLVNGQPAIFPPSGAKPVRYVNAGNFLRTPSEEFLVPPQSYFVLGDNSINSLDSRYWGVVPKANLRGKVWFRYWPWR